MRGSRHPRLFALDARAWLARLSERRGRRVLLGDVLSSDIEPLLDLRIDAVWLIGVWRNGSAGRKFWRTMPWLQELARETLVDGSERDIVGSPYAVSEYEVAPEVGGEDGLTAVRGLLARNGISLLLDFVPNHTALDHPWVRRNPEWYVHGDATHVAAEPEAFFEVRATGRHMIAHGRDPNSAPWRDTAQLDYRHPAVPKAMMRSLVDVSLRCDGVRVDMAMLVLDDIFRATWRDRSLVPDSADPPGQLGEFWWYAIRSVREVYPEFLTIAEAYWGTEWRLQQLGFDYTYDKTLLDRVMAGDARDIAGHLRADEDYQRHSLRFLENHDEPRIAARLAPDRHRAAAVVMATVPGMVMLHDGQEVGARIQPTVMMARRPEDPVDLEIAEFYRGLMAATDDEAFRLGHAVRIEPSSAWAGNGTNENIVARLWVGPHRSFRLVATNLSDAPAQCYIPLPMPEFAGRNVIFADALSDAHYIRPGDDILARGLYLDLPPYGRHLFHIGVEQQRQRRRSSRRPRPVVVS
jgi:hypothetical protein